MIRFIHGVLVGLALLAGGVHDAAAQRTPTPASGIGVWYQPGAPATGDLWRPGDAGRRLLLRGRVLDTSGAAVEDARIELWHADADGVVHADRFRATLSSAPDGSFRASTVLPGYIWGPRHIHFVISHARHSRLITRIFFKRDPEVGASGDPALAVLLEDGRLGDEAVLFADIEFVLPAARD
jgi:protocatechuate 3,4-dioxygenase beta subunit